DRLHGKCLVIRDLTPLFSGRPEKVQEVLNIFLTLFDGKYVRETGTIGRLAFESRFAILGCITPMPLAHHHRYISAIGGRFLYYYLPALTEEERSDGYDAIFNDRRTRQHHQTELRKLVHTYLDMVREWKCVRVPMTAEQQTFFSRLADVVAKGRGVPIWT